MFVIGDNWFFVICLFYFFRKYTNGKKNITRKICFANSLAVGLLLISLKFTIVEDKLKDKICLMNPTIYNVKKRLLGGVLQHSDYV